LPDGLSTIFVAQCVDIVILSDWGSLVSRGYGVRNTSRVATIVVVDEDSNIAASYQGSGPWRPYLA
jgi:hypothetical protein